MNGLADVDGFKICIQVCMWLAEICFILVIMNTDMRQLNQQQILLRNF